MQQLVLYNDLNKHHTRIFWPTKYESLGYNLYRRVYNPLQPQSWDKLNTDYLFVNFFSDSILNKNKKYEYQVKYLDSSSGEVDWTIATTNNNPPGRQAVGNVFPALKAITSIAFNLGKAEYCTILIKPMVGIRCPDCFNSVTQDSNIAWCSTCENTTFVGGYVRFNNILTRFGNFGTRLDPTEMGYELKQTINGQITDYPLVQNQDIIIRPSGERYFVYQDVRKLQLQSLIVKQTFNLREITIETPYYDLA